MKTKTFKLLGVKIWETVTCETLEEVQDKKIADTKVKEEGAILEYSPEEQERDSR